MPWFLAPLASREGRLAQVRTDLAALADPVTLEDPALDAREITARLLDSATNLKRRLDSEWSSAAFSGP